MEVADHLWRPWASFVSIGTSRSHCDCVLCLSTATWRRICCLTKHQGIKAYGEMNVQLHTFLTSALDGGEWWASRLGRFTPGIHWIDRYAYCMIRKWAWWVGNAQHSVMGKGQVVNSRHHDESAQSMEWALQEPPRHHIWVSCTSCGITVGVGAHRTALKCYSWLIGRCYHSYCCCVVLHCVNIALHCVVCLCLL